MKQQHKGFSKIKSESDDLINSLNNEISTIDIVILQLEDLKSLNDS